MCVYYSKNTHPLHDGCWSPTRPAVYYTVSAGGVLDVWDIGFKHNKPTLSIQVCYNGIFKHFMVVLLFKFKKCTCALFLPHCHFTAFHLSPCPPSLSLPVPPPQVCDDPLYSIKLHEQGGLVACGSRSGSTTILQLASSLSMLQPNEKHNANAVRINNNNNCNCISMYIVQVCFGFYHKCNNVALTTIQCSFL